MLRFYHHPQSPYSQKIFFLLEEAASPYELELVALERREHRSALYKALNPSARVPAIKDGDFKLFESNAIIRYLTRRLDLHDTYPVGLQDQAQVDQWWEFCSHHINRPFLDLTWHKSLVFKYGGRPDVSIISRAERDLARDLPVLEQHLTGRHYIVGPTLSLADINLMPFAYYGSQFIALDRWPALQAWIHLVSQRQAWKNVVAGS